MEILFLEGAKFIHGTGVSVPSIETQSAMNIWHPGLSGLIRGTAAVVMLYRDSLSPIGAAATINFYRWIYLPKEAKEENRMAQHWNFFQRYFYIQTRNENARRDALETSETRLLLVFGIAWLVVPSSWVDDDCGLDLIVKCGASFKMSKDSVATATLAGFLLTTYICT